MRESPLPIGLLAEDDTPVDGIGSPDDDVEALLEWTKDLDFDQYVERWATTGLSGRSYVPSSTTGESRFREELNRVQLQQSAKRAGAELPTRIAQPGAVGKSEGSMRAGDALERELQVQADFVRKPKQSVKFTASVMAANPNPTTTPLMDGTSGGAGV